MCELCGYPDLQHLFGEQPNIKPLQKKLKTTILKKKTKKVTKTSN